MVWLRPNRDKSVPLPFWALDASCLVKKDAPEFGTLTKANTSRFRQYILHSSLPHCLLSLTTSCLSAKHSELELIFQLPRIYLLSRDDPSGSTRYQAPPRLYRVILFNTPPKQVNLILCRNKLRRRGHVPRPMCVWLVRYRFTGQTQSCWV